MKNKSTITSEMNSKATTGYAAFIEALRRSRMIEKGSKVYDQEKEDKLKLVEKRELKLGKLLGRGNFCNIFSAKYDKKDYAVKCLRNDTMQNQSKFKAGAGDLITETKFLSCLDHPNIITLHAVSASGITGFLPDQEDYFLLIDRLQENLSQLILRKRKSCKQNSITEYVKRLKMALNISQALQYLHSKNILMRDVKCDNIGLDAHRQIKLFDFGLVTELKDSRLNEDGTYNLTEKTGSLKYMAPENALGNPYNLSADVYSFSIVLWELLCLDIAYKDCTSILLFPKLVFTSKNPWRPPLKNTMLSNSIKSLLEQMWSPSWTERPTMKSITATLQSELESTMQTITSRNCFRNIWKPFAHRSISSQLRQVSVT